MFRLWVSHRAGDEAALQASPYQGAQARDASHNISCALTSICMSFARVREGRGKGQDEGAGVECYTLRPLKLLQSQ